MRVDRLGAVDLRRPHVGRMQAGLNAPKSIWPSDDLRPVAVGMDLRGSMTWVSGVGANGRRLELRHGVGRAHVGPHKAAGLARRIGLSL